MRSLQGVNVSGMPAPSQEVYMKPRSLSLVKLLRKVDLVNLQLLVVFSNCVISEQTAANVFGRLLSLCSLNKALSTTWSATDRS